MLDQQLGGAIREPEERRTPAHRGLRHELARGLESAFENRELTGRVLFEGDLVEVSMKANLVAIGENRFDQVRILIDAVPGEEEGLLDPELPKPKTSRTSAHSS